MGAGFPYAQIVRGPPVTLTVLLATHNRAGSLRDTLDSMAAADRSTVAVEIVVVDNNSTDDTRRVVEEARRGLPVSYVFAGEPGKNRALNRALDETSLGEIVVFTDDDVLVDPAWFEEIAAACAAHPEAAVFGGRIRARWPGDMPRPRWTDDANIAEFGFALQDHGDTPRTYPPLQYPFGPNLWLRREIFAGGRRYRERLGPDWNATMGSETFLLHDLAEEGCSMVYWPAASVEHRIRPEQFEARWIIRRGEIYGRVYPYIFGPPDPEQRARRPSAWHRAQRLAVVRATLAGWAASLRRDPDVRVVKRVWAAYLRGLHTESLKLPGPSA